MEGVRFFFSMSFFKISTCLLMFCLIELEMVGWWMARVGGVCWGILCLSFDVLFGMLGVTFIILSCACCKQNVIVIVV